VLGLKQPKSHTAANGGRGALPMRCHSRHGEHACRRLRIGRHCRAGTAGGAPTGSARDDQNRHPHAHRTRQAPNNNVRNTRTDRSHRQLNGIAANTSDDAVPTEPPAQHWYISDDDSDKGRQGRDGKDGQKAMAVATERCRHGWLNGDVGAGNQPVTGTCRYILAQHTRSVKRRTPSQLPAGPDWS
jgi:hypothetical protein